MKNAEDFIGRINATINSSRNSNLVSNTEIKLSALIAFLSKYAFPTATEAELKSYTDNIDIDNDGIVSL